MKQQQTIEKNTKRTIKLSAALIVTGLLLEHFLAFSLHKATTEFIRTREYQSFLYAGATFKKDNLNNRTTFGIRLGDYMLSNVPKSAIGYKTNVLTVDNAHDLSSEQILELLHSRNEPILFKGGVKNVDTFSILETFGDTSQNIFPACKKRAPLVLGESLECEDITLKERLVQSEAADPDTNRLKAAGAHAVGGKLNSKDILYPLLFDRLGIMDGIQQFLDSKRWLPMVSLIFFARGERSSVSHFHFHFDHFFSYNIEGTKTWEIFHPDFSPLLHPQWSGASFAQSNFEESDLARIPIIKVVQEPGDILFNPSWFPHRTYFDSKKKQPWFASFGTSKTSKSLALNTHVLPGWQGLVYGLATRSGFSQGFYKYMSPIMFGGLKSLMNIC